MSEPPKDIGQCCINCRKDFYSERVVGVCEECARINDHYKRNPSKVYHSIDDDLKSALEDIESLREALRWIEIESRDGTRADFRHQINKRAREALKEKT